MDLKNLTSAVIEIAEEKGIEQEKVIEIIEDALASAYKKEYGQKKQRFVAELNAKTGQVGFWQAKQVVEPDQLLSEQEVEQLKTQGKEETEEEKEGKIRFNPDRHILLAEARKIDKNIELGEDLRIPVEFKQDFGRIAAQTAKQVILQKIKEAERDAILKDFQEKENDIVSGIVQRVEPRTVFFDIGKTSGILPKSEQVPGEFYRPGQRLKLFVLKVELTPKGPVVFLSRAYPKLISKLFELEVPEISAEQVDIKSIAREPGSRTKIAVTANEDGIDPIGSLVGQRGTRILAVINELGGEKIDVVEWSENPERYIINALSPAKVIEVKIMPKNTAEAVVPDDQLSLAIGKDGQNVRLAAKLTGWKIDVKSESEAAKTAGQRKKKAEDKTEDKAEEKEKKQINKEKQEKKSTKKKTGE